MRPGAEFRGLRLMFMSRAKVSESRNDSPRATTVWAGGTSFVFMYEKLCPAVNVKEMPTCKTENWISI